MLILGIPSNASWTTRLTTHYLCVLVSTLNWIFFEVFLFVLLFTYKHVSEFHCFNITVNINCFSILDITVNTILNITLSTYLFVHIEALNEKLKLMVGMLLCSTKLLRMIEKGGKLIQQSVSYLSQQLKLSNKIKDNKIKRAFVSIFL